MERGEQQAADRNGNGLYNLPPVSAIGSCSEGKTDRGEGVYMPAGRVAGQLCGRCEGGGSGRRAARNTAGGLWAAPTERKPARDNGCVFRFCRPDRLHGGAKTGANASGSA